MDEVEKNGVLLAWGGGLGRAEGGLGDVVRCWRWGSEEEGNRGEDEGEGGGDMHCFGGGHRIGGGGRVRNEMLVCVFGGYTVL